MPPWSSSRAGRRASEQFRVPTYIYVLDGILTTDYEAGPVGIQGAQYHAAGQSFMDNGGWWHNHMNKSNKPVKYLMLHLGYPGRPDPVQKAEGGVDGRLRARGGAGRGPAYFPTPPVIPWMNRSRKKL